MSQALRTDLYQLTMMDAYLKDNHNPRASFDYFVRKIPFGSYLVTAGLPFVLSYVENLKFSSDDLAYLARQRDLSKAFLEYLESFRFTGDIAGMPEGELAFPREPILRMGGPLIEIQLVETFILNKMNFSSLIATKASRVAYAARGKPILEFGLRRAQGDAGLEASRAAFIGGCAATSNVEAGKEYGIPISGTMAHSFVMSYPSELEAFRAYARAHPANTVLLVDTYDTLEGVKNAIVVAKELEEQGHRLKGIRLDSGDFDALSRASRFFLNDAGFGYVQIFASSDLNEWKIDTLERNSVPIDAYGVGTEMITSRPDPALGGVYKLLEIEDAGGNSIPKMKLSSDPEKATLPGKKTVWRFFNPYGLMERDVIALEGEKLDTIGAREVLVPLVKDGKAVYQEPALAEVRDLARENLFLLSEEYLALDYAPAYPVELSPGLENLSRELIQKLTVRK